MTTFNYRIDRAGGRSLAIQTKHRAGRKWFWRDVNSAQRSGCQSDEIQVSAGKRRE